MSDTFAYRFKMKRAEGVSYDLWIRNSYKEIELFCTRLRHETKE